MSREVKLYLAGLLLTCSIAWLGREAWLSALGRYLAETRGGLPVADVVVVPAADDIRADVSIETLQEAAGLVRAGRVQHFVMSCADEVLYAPRAHQSSRFLQRLDWCARGAYSTSS